MLSASWIQLSPAIVKQQGQATAAAWRERGRSIGEFLKTNASHDTSRLCAITGKLFHDPSGWLLLSVPEALVRGVFDTLDEEGIELPRAGGRLGVDVIVADPAEVRLAGGEDAFRERGQDFPCCIRCLRSVQPRTWPEVERIWYLELHAPQLEEMRWRHGLSRLPRHGRIPFHIVTAVRRRSVTRLLSSPRADADAAREELEIKESPIDGKGLFAKRDYAKGERVARAVLTRFDDDVVPRYEESEWARFTNHSGKPNVRLELDGRVVHYVATRDIERGEEITTDYRAIDDVLGPCFYFSYRGVPYLGESTSGKGPDAWMKDAFFEKAAVAEVLADSLPLLNLLVVHPLIASWAARHGLLYLPGPASMSLLDRLRQLELARGGWEAYLGMMPEDAPRHRQLIAGMARLMGASPENNPALRAAIDRAAADIQTVAPVVAALAPEFWDRLHGRRGSAAGLGTALYQTQTSMRDPTTFTRRLDAGPALEKSRLLFRELYGPDSRPQDTSGLTAGQVGQMYSELHQRGLLSSSEPPTPTTEAAWLRRWTQPVAAMRDLTLMNEGLAKTGLHLPPGVVYDGERKKLLCPYCHEIISKNELYRDSKGWIFHRKCFRWQRAGPLLIPGARKSAASMPELIASLERMTHGQLGNMAPERVALVLRQLQTLAPTTPGGLPRLLSQVSYGGRLAETLGLPRAFGFTTVPSTAAFLDVWRQRAGRQGIGGLTLDEAAVLDHQLRAGAAASPAANQLAAALALDEAGLLQPGTPGKEIADAVRGHEPVTESGIDLRQLTNVQWVRYMAESGVSPDTAWTQLRSRQVNQDIVYRHDLADFVRTLQGSAEIGPYVRNMLSMGMAGATARTGLPAAARRQLEAQLARSLYQILEDLPAERLADDRSAVIREAAWRLEQEQPELAQRYGRRWLHELTHSAITSTDQGIRSDPRFSAYRNLIGVLTAHRPDLIHAAAMISRHSADEAYLRGRMAHQVHGDWLRRLSDAVSNPSAPPSWSSVLVRTMGAEPPELIAPALGLTSPLEASSTPAMEEPDRQARPPAVPEILTSPLTAGPPVGPGRKAS